MSVLRTCVLYHVMVEGGHVYFYVLGAICLTEESATNRVLVALQRGDYTEEYTKREGTMSPSCRPSQHRVFFISIGCF